MEAVAASQDKQVYHVYISAACDQLAAVAQKLDITNIVPASCKSTAELIEASADALIAPQSANEASTAAALNHRMQITVEVSVFSLFQCVKKLF